MEGTGRLAQFLKAMLLAGKSGVRFLHRSNRTQCCQQLATGVMCFRSCVAQRQAAKMDPTTRYTLRRNTASIRKIWFFITAKHWKEGDLIYTKHRVFTVLVLMQSELGF